MYRDKLRKRPLAVFGLPLEYLGFAAGVSFGIWLVVTRAPLAAFERLTGLAVRAWVVDLVARVAPG